MDAVTAFASSLSEPALTAISVFFHDYGAAAALPLFALSALFLREKRRIVALAIALLLVFAANGALKEAYKVQRPCAEAPSKVPCPADYAFPSGHAMEFFAFAAAALGTSLFLPYLALALFVSFSRLYLGVHVLNDVIAGALLGVLLYMLSWKAAKRVFMLPRSVKAPLGNEAHRQAVHVAVGLLAMLLISAFGVLKIEAPIFLLFLSFAVVIHLKISGAKIPLVDSLLAMLEREKTLPAGGAFWYIGGLLFIMSFYRGSVSTALAIIAVLALGDGVSTLANQRGRIALPYNKHKTLEGVLAFFIAGGVPAYMLIGLPGLLLALVGAVVESIYFGLDDNVSIPIACVAVANMLAI